MKIILPLFRKICVLSLFVCSTIVAQVPVANFSMSPNPVCSGPGHVVQITDLSTNAPTAWSYTIMGFGPGPTFSVQNPTVIFNMAGNITVTLIATNASGASAPVVHTISVLPSPVAQINPQNQNTCIGGAVSNLTVFSGGPSGAITYSWSTGATSSVLAVFPTVSSTYSCTITATNGCSLLRTATINIGQPTVSINSLPYAVCGGNTSTLTATGQQPGPFTYSWSTSATTRTISTNVPGVYDVTVTNNNGCSGVQTFTLGTSTSLSLTAVAFPSVICSGNTATLNVQGSNSYTWSTGSSAPNLTVNPTIPSSYTVYSQLGTCTGSTTVFLGVSVIPTISAVGNPTSVCSGNSSTITASGATTYTWLPSTVSQTLVVTPSVKTTYTVRGSNPGCPTRIFTISVSVLPSPVVNIASNTSLTCPGENVALAASGANSYVWNTGGTAVVMIVSPLVTTTYSVVGTATNNCVASAVLTQSVSDCTGIDMNVSTDNLIKIFPNPASGQFTIQSPVEMELAIFNGLGEVVINLHLVPGNSQDVDLSNFPVGIYFMSGYYQGIAIREKIVLVQ